MLMALWWGYLKEFNHIEDLGVDGKIILKWISRKEDWGVWMDSCPFG
jgi:hypothetical protein